MLGGGAVIRAAAVVREKMLRIAADVMEVDPTDLEIGSGRVNVAGVSGLGLTVREIATMAYAMHDRALPAGESFGLEATDFYDPPRATITNATHIAQVAIDPVTGLVDVDRYVVVHDCGRLINPLVVDGQIHGAVVQGLQQRIERGPAVRPGWSGDDRELARLSRLYNHGRSRYRGPPRGKLVT